MDDFITLDHGSGGGKTSDLINDLILPLINRGNTEGRALLDGAVLDIPGDSGKLVCSTDSFVVNPIFFPGGDIGKLSVCGTVNDLAVMGAVPKYLSLSLIIEEGLPVDDLKRIARSIGETAEKEGVTIVTGDTKVVERGRGDGVYINTSGIGFTKHVLKPENIRPGDSVLVSGTVGDHGAAVMLSRNPEIGGIAEEGSALVSDCASVACQALRLADALGEKLRVMRDPTRGGLATTLNEFVEGRTDAGIEIIEKDIPISDTVGGICDILGLDPLYSACEGRITLVTAPEAAGTALDILKNSPGGCDAAIIGHVTEDPSGVLVVRTPIGTGRIAAKLAGAQLPRIC